MIMMMVRFLSVFMLVVLMMVVMVLNVLIGVIYMIMVRILKTSFWVCLMLCRIGLFIGLSDCRVKSASSVTTSVCRILFLVSDEMSVVGIIFWRKF